jgi:ribonuclease HII
MAVRIKYDEKEKQRLHMMTEYERQCYAEGYKLVAGVDEVGRGPLAGPVVAAAVILGEGVVISGVNEALSVGIGMAEVELIDEINILNATYVAMKRAISNLSVQPDYILLDAVTLKDVDIKQQGIIKGDGLSLSIAAASIIAKVERDRLISSYDELYPEYKFSKHKGYGTKEHIECIKSLGLLPIHRKSFTKNIVIEK